MVKNSVVKLVVGLGNPGSRYAETRHNMGFFVVNELARRTGASFSLATKWKSEMASWAGVMLMKPQTYMNLSGEAVASFAHFYKIDPAEIFVIYDDTAFALGEMRLRLAGSGGGHNGISSIISLLGSEKIPRLRIGIGNSLDIPLESFVLSRFTSVEQSQLPEVIMRAANAVECVVTRGIEPAMNQFNQRTSTHIQTHGQE